MTRRVMRLALPLILANLILYGLSARFVPQLDDITRPLTPDDHSYLALCHGHFAGIQEPFRFRILTPFLASLAGDCTRGYELLDFLCTSAAALVIAWVTTRLTRIYPLQLLPGLVYLVLFCPRAHEAPWLTDSFASAVSAAAFALTTAKPRAGLRWLTAGLAAIVGLGRELLPLLFIRATAILRALRARRWPDPFDFAPALLGFAAYWVGTRIIGPQIGALTGYITDALSDTAAKDDPDRYWSAILYSMSFLWPYGLAWLFLRGVEARGALREQAWVIIAISAAQSLMGGDIARLFALFALPVFVVAAGDVVANLSGGRARIGLAAMLGVSALAFGYGLMMFSPPAGLPFLSLLSNTLLILNAAALAAVLLQKRFSDIRR
jgi:hypothetical protein